MAGEGSTYQRADGRWVAQLSFGPRADRSYRRKLAKNRKDAAAKLEDLRVEVAALTTPSTQSLSSYLRWWLEEAVTPNVTPNTVRGYRAAIAHFAPIGHIPLTDLRAEHIEAASNGMRASRFRGARGAADLGPASPKTVRNAQLMLRAALAVAAERGHVRRNEAKLVKLRRVPRINRPALTPTAARAIRAAVAGDRYEAAYALAMSALRENEVLGLSRADVDLELGRVTIRHQLRGSGRTARLAPTKTEGSADTIDLPAFVVASLRRHVERHDPPALLFTTERGYAVNGSWFTKHFQALLERAGIPRMRLHDLRGGASDLFADAGAHVAIARDFLRHESETTTLRHYTRTTPEQRRLAAELLDAAYGGTDDDPTR